MRISDWSSDVCSSDLRFLSSGDNDDVGACICEIKRNLASDALTAAQHERGAPSNSEIHDILLSQSARLPGGLGETFLQAQHYPPALGQEERRVFHAALINIYQGADRQSTRLNSSHKC